jgi:gamma-glutamylcyclotransferase
MKYFAYGSNMLTERLTRRASGARCLGTARALGRRLAFHKRSSDGSGKCDIPLTGNNSDVVYGVLFDVPDSRRPALDEREGVGYGYEASPIEVLESDSSPILAIAYLATADDVDPRLVPYDWYHRLVVTGMRQHQLPDDYVSSVVATRSVPDPDPRRKTRLEALQALKNASVEFAGNA